MNYVKYLFGLILSLTFSDFTRAGDFGAVFGEIGSLIAEAAFDPIIRSVGGDLGKLTQEQIDELEKKGIDVWPPGATADEIKELKKQGYKPKLNWSAPGTQYAYDRDGWIEYWRAFHQMMSGKIKDKLKPYDPKSFLGDYGNLVVDEPFKPFEQNHLTNSKTSVIYTPTPYSAAEMLRTQYAPAVIKIAQEVNKQNQNLCFSQCSPNDWKSIANLWGLINVVRPVTDQLEKIVMTDRHIYKLYYFIFDLDKLAKNSSFEYGSNNVVNWISKKQPHDQIYGAPPH